MRRVVSAVLCYISIMHAVCAELSCQRCASGRYLLAGQCVACPANSTTLVHVNATAATDCVCVSGFTNVSGMCEACDATFFKAEIGNVSCTACPANTTSRPGSLSPEACECVAGFRLAVDTCTPCAADTWKHGVGNSGCEPCDAAAHAAPGSTRAEQCLCNAGYAGRPGASCEACVAGTYRTAVAVQYICTACPVDTYNDALAATAPEQCTPCPNHTSTLNTSAVASARQCTCTAGYYRAAAWAQDWACRACAAGSYQRADNQSSCEMCTVGKYASAVAAAADVCEACALGKYAPTPGVTVCLLCSPHTWMAERGAGECNACPSNSLLNSSGASNVSDCVCVAGFREQAAPHRCEECAAGAYCPGRGEQRPCNRSWSSAGASTCTACAVNSMPLLAEGMTTPTQCQCRPGSEGTHDSNCSLCPAGKFQEQDYDVSSAAQTAVSVAVSVTCQQCPPDRYQSEVGSVSCLTCPEHAAAPAGSDGVNDCLCVPGFYSTISLHNDTCVVCPAGSFCEGGHPEPTPCRAHTNSSTGSKRNEDCVCDAGYYNTAPGKECLSCPRAEYCHGNMTRTQCPGNSSSAPRSGDVTACMCVPGTWRGCTLGFDGQRVDVDGVPCTVDYMLPCTACPSDTLCANETLWHCPDHSEAPPGTSRREGCTCDDGYYNTAVHDMAVHNMVA